MNILYVLFSGSLLFLALAADAQKKPKVSKDDYLITLETKFGEMKIILHEQTPKHRENFLKLVQSGFYDDLLFHRIIENFMIQGGDPTSKNAQAGEMLGTGNNGYRVDAEFVPELFHKKGALAAARDNNPEKASSGCQFYIVQGQVWKAEDLDRVLQRTGLVLPDAHREVYESIGGSPHLDQQYTVFGQVIAGLEVIDKIATLEKDMRDRPREDVRMKFKVEKMKKSKITKLYGYQYPKA
jgi:peptidyl-prolyl cis-trans isomerase B (cyclophilin B)